MTTTLFWLLAFVLLYWAFCMYWGMRGAMLVRTATDYFIGGRSLPFWVWIPAVTVTSFSGWIVLDFPAEVFRGGFPATFGALSAIAIPFAGLFFLKRQWMLGRRYGYVTPGEMFADYFQGDGIRLLSVGVALVFAIPFLGLLLRASAFLFSVLTGGLIGIEAGTWVFSVVLFIYVAAGGLRSVADVGTGQWLMLVLGTVALGTAAAAFSGGWDAVNLGIAHLARSDAMPTPDGLSHYTAIPGAIQFVGAAETAVGGPWSAFMILSFMIALMGVQASPAFSMWAFSSEGPQAFVPQQVWVSGAAMGLVLILFATLQGIAGHLLGANGAMVDAGFAQQRLGVDPAAFEPGALVPLLMNLLEGTAPWLIGLLAICALAGLQAAAALHLSTTGAILARDVYKHFLDRTAHHGTQVLFGRVGVLSCIAVALLLCTYGADLLLPLGGLALAFGAQLAPALIAVCWIPWFSRQGVTAGLAAGLAAVVVTEGLPFGWWPWGRWPFTVHSAGWGLLANLAVCGAVSYFTQERRAWDHRLTYHRFLYDCSALRPSKRALVPAAWIVALLWFFFAVGPGALIGNTIFGDAIDPATWSFGMPSIWTWQVLWWILGVGMLWFLAAHMELSMPPHRDVEGPVDDIGDREMGRM